MFFFLLAFLFIIVLPDFPTPCTQGALCKDIKKGDSTWTVEESGGQFVLTIELTKVKADEWWDCAIQGHPKIDTMLIEPENSSLG